MEAPRYVELVRVSAQQQADRGTPAQQREDLDQLRVSRPGILVERIDPDAEARALGLRGVATSAGKDRADRSDLQRLLRLVKEGKVDEVRVYRLDRVSRHEDIRERAEVIGCFRDHKIVVVETNGSVLNFGEDMGELSGDLRLRFASWEKKAIRERTSRGKDQRRRNGEWVQGSRCLPYGTTYDFETKVWGYDGAKVPALRAAFHAFADGATLKHVSRLLGVTSSGARVVLENPIYMGTIRYDTMKVAGRVRPRSQIIEATV